MKLVIFSRLDDRYLNDLLVIVLSYMSISFTLIHVTLSMCTMSTVMFLDVSDLLNTVRQFLSWNINMHWQRLISCGYRTYPTELLMAEMIDILSLNNGVAIPCRLQSATRAISEMFRSIKLSACTITCGRISRT